MKGSHHASPPQVFHTHCHIPTLTHMPTENEKWQCMLCTDIDSLQLLDSTEGEKRKMGLTTRDTKVAQRILLELYCNYEASQPFRELVDREVRFRSILSTLSLQISPSHISQASMNILQGFFCLP